MPSHMSILQLVSLCQAGTLVMWMPDTGQKVKQFSQIHGNSEVTCMSQDQTQSRLFTGSTDGTVKVTRGNRIKSVVHSVCLCDILYLLYGKLIVDTQSV